MNSKPLVVGAPRSGFSLLINVINSVYRVTGTKPKLSENAPYVDAIVRLASVWLTDKYYSIFRKHGLSDSVVFNGEFHLMVGGPKFLDTENPSLMKVRKYIGVKGMGDFLFIVSHPREAFDYHTVVHSHSNPSLWPKLDYYDSYNKFTSIRNPIGIINSACFSLNAMASEYIQRFLPDEDEYELRQRLALYKLTDPEFIKGLAKFLKKYLDEYLPVSKSYHLMRWEDLISDPLATVQAVASDMGMDISVGQAEEVWRPMDHVNLMEFHKHNYRKGKGIVGDWKNSLVQQHLEVLGEYGFDEYLEILGYPSMPRLNPKEYSPFQKLIARLLERGEIFKNYGDPDLFGFAFNKSNIDASKYNFKSRDPKTWTHVERTTLTNDDLVDEVSETIESACEVLNPMIIEIGRADLSSDQSRKRVCDMLNEFCGSIEMSDSSKLNMARDEMACFLDSKRAG